MHKRKSFFKNFDNDAPAKIQKKMHQTKSLTRELNDHKEKDGQYDVFIENKNDRDVAKKKINHQNKSFTGNFFDADFDSLNFINEYLINNKFKETHNKPSNVEIDPKSVAEQYVIHDKSRNEEPVKKTKKIQKSKSSSREDEDVVGKYNTMEEFLKDELIKEKKKRHKTKFASMELDDDRVAIQHTTNVKSEGEENIKEKKKKHKNKSSCKEVEVETLAVQHNTNVEFQKEHIKEKKRHKNRSTFVEQYDKSVAVHVTNVESVGEEPIKEKKKRHKTKFASMELDDEIVAIQHTTNVESEGEENIKEKKKKHKNKSSSREVEVETLAVQQNANVEFQKERIKEKRHKNKSTFMEQYDKSVAVTNVESVGEEPIKEKKKRHKNKLTSVDLEDKNHAAHHVIDLEYVQKQSVKEKKKRHKAKVHNEECILESNVDNPSPILNHSEKNKRYPTKPGNKDEKKSSNAMLGSSDEELYDIGSSVHLITRYLDFREEPVEFEVPLLHSCESVQQIGEEEREDLKSKGISFKIGRFSEIENTLLKRNYEKFTRRFGVKDPQLLLGLGLKYRNKEVANFLKAKHFYVRLGKDLNNRPLCYIYKKARMLFDPRQKHKRLDATKVNHLKKSHDLLGNKWQDIGNIIHRSANTTRSAFFWHDEPVNLGKWTSEEKSKLIKAIKTVLGVTDLFETKLEGISWENVANLVKTRNFHQCRLYWFENLSWKFKDIQWDRKDFSKLVSILSRECYVEDYTEIDWKEVQKCFGDSSPSWQFLRKKFYSLRNGLKRGKKVRHEKMTYKQMLDYFCAKYKLDIETRENELT